MEKSIGVPSVKGITGALKSAAVGGAGGLLVGLSQSVLGNGMAGGLAGIALAGSVLKGESADIISTILGFQLAQNLFSGVITNVGSAVKSAYEAV